MTKFEEIFKCAIDTFVERCNGTNSYDGLLAKLSNPNSSEFVDIKYSPDIWEISPMDIIQICKELHTYLLKRKVESILKIIESERNDWYIALLNAEGDALNQVITKIRSENENRF